MSAERPKAASVEGSSPAKAGHPGSGEGLQARQQGQSEEQGPPERGEGKRTGEASKSEKNRSEKNKATPWLGIGAVMIGLSTSVFIGQLVGIGVSDLEGAQHLSKDQGSWLTAVYNAGQMFIGPLTVYAGSLLGPRKVLLISAPLVALSTLLLGFMTSYPFILVLLAVAGLGCGTFYPLTLSYVAKSLPRPYILFGFAAYGFDIVCSLHIASLLEGSYMQYLSWRWIYWQPALMALAMWILVYVGMPPDPTASLDTQKLRPTWQGFVYSSLGLTCLYLLLTQGVRLDWGNSGMIVALGSTGAFLLLASLVTHLLKPNSLVDFGFIFRRNILLLSLTMCVLRSSLLSSAQLVPTFLSTVQRMIPLQIGSVLAWVALPALLFGVLAAILMQYVNTRLLLAFGFTLIGVACLWDNKLTSLWSRQNFFPTELLIGVGASVAIVGLIGSIVLDLVSSDAIKNPIQTLTFVAWFHTVRLFGGEIVSASLGYLLYVRFKFHYAVLADFININRAVTAQQLLGTGAAFSSQTSDLAKSLERAGVSLAARLEVQSLTLSIADAYMVEAVVLVAGLFIVACMRYEPQFRDLIKEKQ